jgi:hypothetical protein
VRVNEESKQESDEGEVDELEQMMAQLRLGG